VELQQVGVAYIDIAVVVQRPQREPDLDIVLGLQAGQELRLVRGHRQRDRAGAWLALNVFRPLPADASAYAAALRVESFPSELQAALRAFAAERHAFLLAAAAEAPGRAGPITPDQMEPSEPT